MTTGIHVPQAAHLVSAAICWRFGRSGTPKERVLLWASCACVYAAVGAAGLHWGQTELPLAYTAWGPEPGVFRPIPGLVELRAIDSVIQLGLSAFFGGGAFATAWAHGLLARLLGAWRYEGVDAAAEVLR